MIKGSRACKRAMFIVGAAVLILAAAAAVNVVPSGAVDPPPPIAAETLTAREALAWTFGFDNPDDYTIRVET